jgi:ABC-type nitrate/sulfonate/bicarbonate transport system permease component
MSSGGWITLYPLIVGLFVGWATGGAVGYLIGHHRRRRGW